MNIQAESQGPYCLSPLPLRQILSHTQSSVYNKLKEGIQVASSLKLLTGIQTICIKSTPANLFAVTLTKVVVVPFFEELIFRGALCSTIAYLQKYTRQKVPTQADLKAERASRIAASALIFSLAHAMNPHPSLSRKISHLSSCFICGITLGWLSEMENSLATPMLYHGIHNLICSVQSSNFLVNWSLYAMLKTVDIAVFIWAAKTEL